MCVDRNPRLKMRTWGCGALSPHARAHVCTSQPNSDKQFDLSLRFGCKLLRLTSVQAALMLKLPSWFFFSLFGPTRCAINKMQGPKWRRALGYRLRLLLQGQTHLDTLEGRQPSPWRPCSYVPFNEVKKCAVHSWWNAARSWGGGAQDPRQTGLHVGERASPLVTASLAPRCLTYWHPLRDTCCRFSTAFLLRWTSKKKKKQLRLNKKVMGNIRVEETKRWVYRAPSEMSLE